ncbi:MAG TPA: GntR family transcriptional regulator [Planctomycetota bacterium]|nr:GntR family transcriptional regulator [Planctomycetota bacterium]
MKFNLSDYIRDDFRSRVLTGQNIPPRLTLPALARLYSVSIMPVRIAIKDLLDEQIVLRKQNGRLSINPEKLASRQSQKLPPPSARPANPYDVVLADVMALSLRGKAREMKIIPSSERYNVSRSMIHTIFHRLASLGLLEHTPRRGWTVRPFRAADLDAYLNVREVLELLALDLSRERLEPQKLRELLELNQPLSEKDTMLIDNSLHRYWIRLSENRYIQDFFSRHQMYYDVLLTHAVLKRQHVEISRASHRRILEAMLRRDWAEARAELIRDIRRLSPLLKETVHRLESGKSAERKAVVTVTD